MKYIVMRVLMPLRDGKTLAEDGQDYMEFPFTFGDSIVHDHMRRSMQLMLSFYFPKAQSIKCVAGGFFSSMAFGEAECHGQSESTGVKSREARDTRLLLSMDYGGFHGNTLDDDA